MKRGSYVGKIAIVTGGGSGIGAALGSALGRCRCAGRTGRPGSGGRREGRRRARLSKRRRARRTDAVAVQSLVDSVVAEHGRLDLMFNNAGISLLGETQDLPLDQWNAIIDVNIRGVVHGVAAAYPR